MLKTRAKDRVIEWLDYKPGVRIYFPIRWKNQKPLEVRTICEMQFAPAIKCEGAYYF